MKNVRRVISGNKISFEYICIDPAFDGKWKILSHKELTEVEIQKQLRIMATCGYERPQDGKTTSFKWPKD